MCCTVNYHYKRNHRHHHDHLCHRPSASISSWVLYCGTFRLREACGSFTGWQSLCSTLIVLFACPLPNDTVLSGKNSITLWIAQALMLGIVFCWCPPCPVWYTLVWIVRTQHSRLFCYNRDDLCTLPLACLAHITQKAQCGTAKSIPEACPLSL